MRPTCRCSIPDRSIAQGRSPSPPRGLGPPPTLRRVLERTSPQRIPAPRIRTRARPRQSCERRIASDPTRPQLAGSSQATTPRPTIQVRIPTRPQRSTQHPDPDPHPTAEVDPASRSGSRPDLRGRPTIQLRIPTRPQRSTQHPDPDPASTDRRSSSPAPSVADRSPAASAAPRCARSAPGASPPSGAPKRWLQRRRRPRGCAARSPERSGDP